MKYMLLLGFAFLWHSLYAQKQHDWETIYKTAEKYLVDIEYYEEIDSPESIRNGNKVKRSLNGIIVDSKGLIITSTSIFRARLDFSGSTQYGSSNPPTDIKVKNSSGETFNAEFIGKDDDKNVAFVQTKPVNGGLKFKKSLIPVGQDIFLAYKLAENYNFHIAVIKRNVNSIIKLPQEKLLVEILPDDARFGVALNSEGKAVGIFINSKNGNPYSYDYHTQQSGFTEVLLAESFADLIKDPPRFMKKETSRKKWLGVNMQPFTRKLAAYFKVRSLQGILINTILDDSPAKEAGLKSGDVLVEFNGIELSAEENSDLQYFRNLVREFEGDKVAVRIWRDGAFLEKEVTLAEVPISQHLADEISSDLLGFSAKELTKDIIIAKQWDFDINGVWISKVERAGWADLAGLQIGDLLLKVDNKDLHSIKQLDNYLEDIAGHKPDYISFFVKRRSETRFLFIKTNFN